MIYFIATKHPDYAVEEFPAGSVVIDPWRYIPDQEGVTVKRIGENKPELISILVPSRGRPEQFARMNESAIETATHVSRIEFVTYLDEDDPTVERYPMCWTWDEEFATVEWIQGPRIVLSEMWNRCYDRAQGDILMHCGDDIIFRTPGWDAIVRKVFDDSRDKLILVHGDDCSPNSDRLATHSFLHRKWVETVGYFVPPFFSSDWNDVWLTEIADMIDRRVKVPIVTEHMHYAFGKAKKDKNTEEREERGERDEVDLIYRNTHFERKRDAALLREAMR